VIPALGSLDALETTLVSVLQNRPSDCEVVVALDEAYDDPYELAGEVRFLTIRGAESVAAALGTVVRMCCGSVVYLLAAGVEVEEGWCDAPPTHFADDRVAAVAPRVLRGRSDAIVCSAGVEYAAGGRRLRRAGGDDDAHDEPAEILGPSSLAAFYRRDALLRLPRAFEPGVTDRLIDVDTALQLKAAGYRAVFEPRSIVYRGSAASAAAAPFAAGRGAERLFWRNAPTVGLVRSLVAHPVTVAAELFDSQTIGAKLARLAGRVAACAEIMKYRRHHAALRALGAPDRVSAVTSTGDRVRLDGPHTRPAVTSKTTVREEVGE
jgi:hypothetical protein